MATPADTPYGTIAVPIQENEPNHDVPPGGTTGQILAKQSNADYDVEWEAPSVITPLVAYYTDNAMGAGTAPTLTLNAAAWTSDADGVACEVDGVTPAQINILENGVYSVTAQGFLFKAGTTGGAVVIRIYRGDLILQFDGEAGSNAADGGEIDACVTFSTALLVGDKVVFACIPFGTDNTGNTFVVLVSKLS